ncbi:MAG TPA: SPOR domain-containing protein, partial [Candidatus Binatia bacterium]|nr:SPOR domain-containing protein [Candidatus Binatia bacterium]
QYENLRAAKPSGKASPLTEQQASIPSNRPGSANDRTEAHDQTELDGYVLQVGTFRERDRAESVYRQMSDNGFEAFVEPTLLQQGETAYRVRVGPYSELLTAQETAHDILTKSGHKVLILPLQPAQREESDPS